MNTWLLTCIINLDYSNYKLQIQQVIQRLFPFGRGLCHAYWAPNFWVFYIMSDKGLAFILRKLGFNIQTPAASFTAGLVGDSSPFSVLPRVGFVFMLFCSLNKLTCYLIEKMRTRVCYHYVKLIPFLHYNRTVIKMPYLLPAFP